jgi:glutathione reductase (NADPH)
LNNQTAFDLVVIGTGTAGSTAASECRSKGLSVAIIDSQPFGGTCALRGCEPKKVYHEAAKTIDSNQRHEDKGIRDSKSTKIAWPDLFRYKRTFTDFFPKHREEAYVKSGIVPFHGLARFIGPTKVKVDLNDYDGKDGITLEGKHILIATGAIPAKINIHGSENMITSDQFLDFEGDQLPENIVFVGGGYISFEFAHIAVHAGCKKVTILHRGKQPLGHFDPDLVGQIIQRSQDIGIDIRLQASVKSIRLSCEGEKTVEYSSNVSPSKEEEGEGEGDRTLRTLKAGMVVHGAGRVPNIEDLNLTAGEIEYTDMGVKVNEYLQSISNPLVYAAGDVAAAVSGGSPLTPVASYDGNVVANNLLNGNSLKTNYSGLPSVVFTIPPIASVGLRESDAKEHGFKFKVNHKNTSGWYSSRRVGETCSGFKVLVEEGSDRILGAHLVGPHAEEVINLFSVAIRLGLSAKDLNDPLLYAYPTNSSDLVYML